MRVYLAGPIFGRSDAECNDWRARAKVLLAGHETFDPMTRDYRSQEKTAFMEIVRGDKRDIALCDAVLAMCERPSWGTAMELHYAHIRCKTIVAVVPGDAPISPWLLYHAETFRSLAEAIDWIKGKNT